MNIKIFICYLLAITGAFASDTILKTFPIGLHSLDEVAQIHHSVHENLKKIEPYVGVLRPVCDGKAKYKGTGFVIINDRGEPTVMSAYHVLQPFLKDPSCEYQFMTPLFSTAFTNEDIVSSSVDHDRYDRVVFSFLRFKLTKKISALRRSDEAIKPGMAIVAIGFPANKINKLSVCFGHAVSSGNQGYKSTACAEPSMSGGPVFSIQQDGSLHLVGYVPLAIVPNSLIALKYAEKGVMRQATLPFNIYNDVFLSGTLQTFVQALAGAEIKTIEKETPGLYLSGQFTEASTALKTLLNRAKVSTDHTPDKVMAQLIGDLSRYLEKYSLLVADVPILPLTQEMDASDVKEFAAELDASLRNIAIYEAALKAKQKAFSRVKLTEDFTTELMKTGVYADDAKYRTYVFPMMLVIQGLK